MKNLSLILNGILIIAVAFLYYDEFADSDNPEEAVNNNELSLENLSIAYVNSDTLLTNYNYTRKLVTSLMKNVFSFSKNIPEGQKAYRSKLKITSVRWPI